MYSALTYHPDLKNDNGQTVVDTFNIFQIEARANGSSGGAPTFRPDFTRYLAVDNSERCTPALAPGLHSVTRVSVAYASGTHTYTFPTVSSF